jgi:hypothetical protein
VSTNNGGATRQGGYSPAPIVTPALWRRKSNARARQAAKSRISTKCRLSSPSPPRRSAARSPTSLHRHGRSQSAPQRGPLPGGCIRSLASNSFVDYWPASLPHHPADVGAGSGVAAAASSSASTRSASVTSSCSPSSSCDPSGSILGSSAWPNTGASEVLSSNASLPPACGWPRVTCDHPAPLSALAMSGAGSSCRCSVPAHDLHWRCLTGASPAGSTPLSATNFRAISRSSIGISLCRASDRPVIGPVTAPQLSRNRQVGRTG